MGLDLNSYKDDTKEKFITESKVCKKIKSAIGYSLHK